MTMQAPMASSASAAPIAENETALRDFVEVLRRRWLMIVLFTLAGVGVASLMTSLQPRLYSASATAVVNPTVTDNPAVALNQDTLAKSRAVQYNELAQSSLVADRATTLVKFPLDARSALNAISTKVPSQTSMIEVHATLDDPSHAAELANAWVEALAHESATLEQASGNQPQVQLDRMLPATVPDGPSSPNPFFNAALGGGAGFALGLVTTALMELLDRRIRGSVDLERFGLTPIGMIPAAAELADGKRLAPEDGASPDPLHFRIREAFNDLRINLQFMNPDAPPRIVTVTSVSPGDGKSTVAANLAVTLARANVPVVLVDADLRKPTVATTFRLPRSAGLSDVVVGRAEFADAIHAPAGFEGLHVVPAGQIPPNPTELLTSERFKQALEALAETHMVIVDAPPLLAVSDAAVMATRLHGAVLVLNAKSTTRDQVHQALTSLDRVHAPVLGVVMNRVEMKGKDSRYGYYGGSQDMNA